MGNEWRKYTLGELGRIVGGATPSTADKENYEGGTISWITPKDLSGFNERYITHGKRMITKKGLDSCSAQLIPKNTILFTSRAPIGYIAIAGKELCTNQGFKSILPTNSIDYLFLYYLLQYNKHYIESIGSGTTFKEISASTMKNIEVSIPVDINLQRKISHILSTLDSKIECNNKINANLEAQAQALYRHYFVDNVKKEWKKVSLGNSSLSYLLSSGINTFDGEKVYLATADVQGVTIVNSKTKITFSQRPSRANMQPIEYSVWFAKKGGIQKKIMFANDDKRISQFILSTGFSGLKTTEISHYYIWCYVLSVQFDELKESYLSGSVQPDINNEGIKSIFIYEPDINTLMAFNSKVQSLFSAILHNSLENSILSQLRDTLLPKLMSGRLDVSHLSVENEVE